MVLGAVAGWFGPEEHEAATSRNSGRSRFIITSRYDYIMAALNRLLGCWADQAT
jgi:hypothetical protein